MTRTVIVGAGVAGVQTALELRHRGYAGDITLISEDMEEPYDRPALSKEFLKGSVGRDTLGLLPAQTASERAITMRLGSRVSDLRTSEQQVVLSDGSSASYDYLVLATGAHNRPLPVPGADLPGVWSLRGLDEAEGLRSALAERA
ncbi:FAD-dependent oxidoreductase [Rhodococcus sp. IEGM 1307]|jgi:3-phenylpropionate/trans-cinnamate dioxygenase ferredoxin reductase subunit|uniref:FAD-dependent oxidoreductase n=1 Tax=Rhodococcus sp. IEGM 1307 TaxID=3047091 RepID=UPI0024B7CB30|nr:FAD-dependent oxidoreductase [Rhodococcus sp. IEGM 1307]MDI9978145.1 FAD-dependent oxidoreductase [Rhodococcus sp. IEGM 1307]